MLAAAWANVRFAGMFAEGLAGVGVGVGVGAGVGAGAGAAADVGAGAGAGAGVGGAKGAGAADEAAFGVASMSAGMSHKRKSTYGRGRSEIGVRNAGI